MKKLPKPKQRKLIDKKEFVENAKKLQEEWGSMTHTPIEKINIANLPSDDAIHSFLTFKINELISHVTELEKEVERVKNHRHDNKWGDVIGGGFELHKDGAVTTKKEPKQECTCKEPYEETYTDGKKNWLACVKCGLPLPTKQEKGKHTTHGFCIKGKNSKFYRTWGNIKTRCNNSSSDHYKNYGGRGIKNEWNKFIDFYNDMYESWLSHVKKFGEKATTIDRIDNDGNYCKQNCRWATSKEQYWNSRASKKLFERTSKKCTKCLKTKDLSEFYPYSKTRYNSACKSCCSKYNSSRCEKLRPYSRHKYHLKAGKKFSNCLLCFPKKNY